MTSSSWHVKQAFLKAVEGSGAGGREGAGAAAPERTSIPTRDTTFQP